MGGWLGRKLVAESTCWLEVCLSDVMWVESGSEYVDGKECMFEMGGW